MAMAMSMVMPMFLTADIVSTSPGTRESSPDLNPCDGQCGHFIHFKLFPWVTAPATFCRWSPTCPRKPTWTIELLPTTLELEPTIQEERIQRLERRWSVPKYFDMVRVSVSLEAIKYEYKVRAAVQKAREEYRHLLCVCHCLDLPEEHSQLWPSD
jgi:hypothetical protein